MSFPQDTPSLENLQAPGNLQERIASAPAEEIVALLLAGAQRFTRQAVQAIQDRDLAGRDLRVHKVGAILEQLTIMLNFEEGGPVVDNLSSLYAWWHRELLEASASCDGSRLERIAGQMGSMEHGWEALGVA